VAQPDQFDALEDLGVAADVLAAMRRFVADADDADLINIDPLEFADHHGLREAPTIDAFLHATRHGLFDMAWNVVCPDCGGILSEAVTLRQIRKPELGCSLCDRTYEPDLDASIAVTFTVHPRVRAIRGHRPEEQGVMEYMRQHYLGPTLALPRGAEFEHEYAKFTRWHGVLPPGGVATIDLEIPGGWTIVQELQLHAAAIVELTGARADERRETTFAISHAGMTPSRRTLPPGPHRFRIENRTDHRALCQITDANDALHEMMGRRKSYLTGKQVVTNQTFRNLFRSDVLDLDQGLKLRNLTVLFTDLRGSTELYDRIGDLAAYDLVRRHFGVLGEVVRENDGSVVKTIGDAVMASFPTPVGGMGAALAMRSSMAAFNRGRSDDALVLKIGMHAGPCLAVWSNERLDFFGQTVNVASRVQSIARPGAIVATAGVALDEHVRSLLAAAGATPIPHQATLRGIRDEVTVFEVPPAE